MRRESLNSLAELTGFDRRTIKRKIAHLDIVKDGRSHLYNTADALPLLYSKDGGVYDAEQERARLLHHQANNEALKEATNRGELFPAVLVIELCSALVSASRTKVLAIHSKLRQRFPSIQSEVADEVEQLSHEALSELGSDGIPADLRRRIAPNIRSLQSAAAADDK